MHRITRDEMLHKKIQGCSCRIYRLLPAREKMRCDLSSRVPLLQLQTRRHARTHKKYTCQAQSYECSSATLVRGIEALSNKIYYHFVVRVQRNWNYFFLLILIFLKNCVWNLNKKKLIYNFNWGKRDELLFSN